uniref:Uncharacterized protein n=1 Tax=Anguilla anguilla TaxID=7936 RepID=A0A0E9QC26_ANGAN
MGQLKKTLPWLGPLFPTVILLALRPQVHNGDVIFIGPLE